MNTFCPTTGIGGTNSIDSSPSQPQISLAPPPALPVLPVLPPGSAPGRPEKLPGPMPAEGVSCPVGGGNWGTVGSPVRGSITRLGSGVAVAVSVGDGVMVGVEVEVEVAVGCIGVAVGTKVSVGVAEGRGVPVDGGATSRQATLKSAMRLPSNTPCIEAGRATSTLKLFSARATLVETRSVRKHYKFSAQRAVFEAFSLALGHY